MAGPARRLPIAPALLGATAILAVACGGGPTAPPPPPPPANTPPVIDSIAVSDSRIEVGTPVTLAASVHDQETPVDQLQFSWTADAGTFTGTGASVTYQPADEAASPIDRSITLTVTERYASNGISTENRVTKSVSVHINNSPKELADLSLKFLRMFGDSNVPAVQCVVDFSATCSRDRDEEFGQISDNRHDFRILSSSFHADHLSISVDRLSATVHTFGEISSVILSRPADCVPKQPGDCDPGHIQNVKGDFYTTDVYEQGRWWLCQSHFNPTEPLTPAGRAFMGIR